VRPPALRAACADATVRGRKSAVSAAPALRILLLLVAALVACEKAAEPGPPRRDILGTEKKLYSQFDEELIIRDFFQDRRGGFFLDVGAADPDVNNTTYYLEKNLGWKGIAVDAVLDYSVLWQMKRPHSLFFNYLVTDHAGTLDTFYKAGVRTLSSTQKDRMWGDQKVDSVETQVPSITLTRLLDDNQVTHIDLLSMDIEESEPQALAGFDIDRFKPDLVCIEAVDRVQPKIQAYFDAHGYERIARYAPHDEVNWYFTPKAK
jgi:FkbM family methyltransferase